MRPSAEGEPRDRAGDEPGVFAGHVLAYAELLTALLHAWQRSVQRKALGIVLAGLGLAVFTLLLTVAIVAASWDTPNRWPVVIGVAAAYLAVGLGGIWLLSRQPEVPAPMSVLAGELRKDVLLLSSALRSRRRDARDDEDEDES